MQNKQAALKKERTDAAVKNLIEFIFIIKFFFLLQNAFKGSYHTKASLLRQAKIPVDPKPLWKMAKFASVKKIFFFFLIFEKYLFQGENQVDSFRNESERRKAYSANSFDSIARQGTYHTGIYNVPRTTVKT